MSIRNNTTSLQELLEAVNNLPDRQSGGINLPELTNEGLAEDLMLGKELIDDKGNVITGTFTIDNELSTQDDLIAQIQAMVDGLPEAGSGNPVLQEKTVTPSTSSQTVTADSNYDGLSKVTVNAMPSAVQATPNITVNSSGLITASTTQNAGYVSAGTKSATKQLTTKAATTITPSTTSQTAVASGVYTTGAITVAGDANLIAENIKKGVNIFGVSGILAEGSGGASDNYEDEILDGTLVNYTNTTASKIRDNAFQGCSSLKTVSFTACQHIGQEAFLNCTALTTANFENCLSMASSAFQGCTKLTTISFPACKSVYWAGFSGCTSLATVNLPNCTYLGGRAFQKCTKLSTLSLPLCRQIYSSTFQSCSALTTVSLPAITMIGSTAFGSCTNLNAFYLAGSTLCTLSGSSAFTGTGITSSTGSIFVNASLIDSYKAATNWTYFSNIIYAIE